MSLWLDPSRAGNDLHLSDQALAVLRRELGVDLLRHHAHTRRQEELRRELIGQPDVDPAELEAAEAAVACAHEVVVEVEEAIIRLDDASYGICATCRRPIPIERLLVIPHVRCCSSCGESEKGRPGW